MPDSELDPIETISRFLLKGQIRAKDGAVHFRAFLPSSKLKLSVFRVQGFSEEQVWAIAAEKVEPTRGLVVGRGNLSVSQIVDKKLRVEPDAIPTSKHADIVEWPEDKTLRSTIAMQLAALASPAIKRQTSTA